MQTCSFCIIMSEINIVSVKIAYRWESVALRCSGLIMRSNFNIRPDCSESLTQRPAVGASGHGDYQLHADSCGVADCKGQRIT